MPSEMSNQEHMLLREKRTGAPTAAIESVLIVDTKEHRDVAAVDRPCAFTMQADMEDIVNIRFEGTNAKLLIKLDEKKYEKYSKRISN